MLWWQSRASRLGVPASPQRKCEEAVKPPVAWTRGYDGNAVYFPRRLVAECRWHRTSLSPTPEKTLTPKRALAIVALTFLFVAGISACGGDSENAETKDAPTTTTTDKPAKTKSSKTDQTDVDDEEADGDDAEADGDDEADETDERSTSEDDSVDQKKDSGSDDEGKSIGSSKSDSSEDDVAEGSGRDFIWDPWDARTMSDEFVGQVVDNGDDVLAFIADEGGYLPEFVEIHDDIQMIELSIGLQVDSRGILAAHTTIAYMATGDAQDLAAEFSDAAAVDEDLQVSQSSRESDGQTVYGATAADDYGDVDDDDWRDDVTFAAASTEDGTVIHIESWSRSRKPMEIDGLDDVRLPFGDLPNELTELEGSVRLNSFGGRPMVSTTAKFAAPEGSTSDENFAAAAEALNAAGWEQDGDQRTSDQSVSASFINSDYGNLTLHVFDGGGDYTSVVSLSFTGS